MEGRVAIVTGAARGIGEAVARALAANGVNVVVNDIELNVEQAQKVAKEVSNEGHEAVAIQADVSNYREVEDMVQTAMRKFGSIDILVNNAGILYRRRAIEEIDGSEWDLVMSVNVKGVFNCSKAVIRTMKKQKSGKIVNISSSAGRSTSELGGAHYTTSKTAVLGFTRHLAREVAPFNVNVNAICPGLIDTTMVRNSTSAEELEAQVSAIPMGRLGKPEEVAFLALFLVSDFSAYINGAIIDIGGASLLI
jgi:3-oxoacyl-[acyl-carrier protein] reductase